MSKKLNILVYPAHNIEAAKAFYNIYLGVGPYVDSPYYVGYRLGDFEIGLDPNAVTGPIAYIDVEDIKSEIEALTAVGGEVIQDPQDVGNGLLIAKIKEVNGNVVGFRQQS
ncbi:MAG: VOC family protein [Patescibacteria group bacterium]